MEGEKSVSIASLKIRDTTYRSKALGWLCVFQHSCVIRFLDSQGSDVVQPECEELHKDVCASDEKEYVWTVGLFDGRRKQVVYVVFETVGSDHA